MTTMPERNEPPADAPSPAMPLEHIVKLVVEQVNQGSVSFDDVLKAIAPAVVPPALTAAVPLPKTAALSNAQQQALARLPQVFGQVVPTERRPLQPAEIAALIDEKEVLDEVKKLAESRTSEGIRTAIFNHLDIEIEKSLGEEPPLRDKNGHYVAPGECLGTSGSGKRFTREVRGGAPELSAEALKALADDEDEDFTHDDYLAMTTAVRQVDENKVMLALKKNPNLIHAIRKATVRPAPTTALYLRKV